MKRSVYTKQELIDSCKGTIYQWWSLRLWSVPILICSPIIAMLSELTIKEIILECFEALFMKVVDEVES